MYEYCDLRWSSVILTGLLMVLAGAAALVFPQAAMGFAVVFSGLVILILAGIVIAEGLFTETGRDHSGIVLGTGLLGVTLAAVHILYPELLAAAAGILIGGVLVIFGAVMIFLAASILFSFYIRTLVVLSSFAAILLGIWVLFSPVSAAEDLFLIISAFLIVYGVIRISYGIRLRAWQRSCPASYLAARQ